MTITFDGLEAETGGIDMLLLARSLEGYARILSTTSSFAASMSYQQHMDSMPIRARVQVIRAGSFEIQVFLDFVRQSGILTNFKEVWKALLEWVIAKLASRPESDGMKEIVLKQMELIGVMSAENNAILDKLVDGLIPAARNAASPIGESCATARLSLGQVEIATWDKDDKVAITSEVKKTIQPTESFDVIISELDVNTGTAKVSIGSESDSRIRAKIADPVVFEPDNPYALALASHTPLRVLAKAEMIGGVIAQLHISDSMKI